MKKLTVLSLSVTLFVLAACSKNDPDIPKDENDPPVYDNYAQLKAGNYWVYEMYDVDSLENGTTLNLFDSCYVSGDTIINGHTYYQTKSTLYPLVSYGQYGIWLRDSLHYLIDNYGMIYFSSEDFTTVFRSYPMVIDPDTIGVMSQRMVDKDAVTSTPAGTFTTSNFRTTYHMRPGYNEFGTMRHLHRKYAKDIGIVVETIPFFIADQRYKERRLVRYHVN